MITQPISATRTAMRRLFFQRCFYLFLTLLALIVAAPFIETERSSLIRNLINAFVVLAAVASVGRSVLSFIVVLSLAAPALGFRWLAIKTGNPDFYETSLRFDAAVYAATIALLLRYVFSREVLTADRLWGAAATYLMIGVLWAFLYAIVDQQTPGSYAIRGAPTPMDLMDLLYFSFATLTTTSYGDIVPLTRLGRAMSMLEGIVGQLFITILIARIAGIYPNPTTERSAAGVADRAAFVEPAGGQP